MKILFVDDDPSFLNLLKILFKGFDATYLYTSAEALMQIKHNNFDVVVLDFYMFIEGDSFVKLCNGRLFNKKVYFLTGFDINNVKYKCKQISDRISGCFSKDCIDKFKDEICKQSAMV